MSALGKRVTTEWWKDQNKVAALAAWLPTSLEWDRFGMDWQERCEELIHFIEKPYNYDDEYQIMIGNKFRCQDCEQLCDCETESQAEAAQENREQRCSSCFAEGYAEANGPSWLANRGYR